MNAERPPRNLPTVERICADLGVKRECFKCGKRGHLQRAHMIDRWSGGLDLSSNLRLLCASCHHHQPMFRAGDEAEADAWFDEDWSPVLGFYMQTIAIMAAELARLKAATS